MNIYFDSQKIERIPYEDLIDLGNSVKYFVDTYRKTMLIRSEQEVRTLQKLEMIADAILEGHENLLFNNPQGVIDYDPVEYVNIDEAWLDDGMPF